MKERPILFRGAMVRAIQSLLKRVTRREVNRLLGFGEVTEFGRSDTCGYDWHFRDKAMRWHDIKHERLLEACPYGRPGERLWVRETFSDCGFGRVLYRADYDSDAILKWTPAIHMPRWASRILLEVVSVRVERLQAISADDAEAEGISMGGADVAVYRDNAPFNTEAKRRYDAYRITVFRSLWESINGAGSWDANPWVWVVAFKRVTP